MARRKEKNGEKSPWGQCLTRPVSNGRRRSAFWLGTKTQKFSGTNQKPERPRQFGTGLVRHCPQGLFWPFFTFLCAIFSRPFRLSLAPTICPWVSEDVSSHKLQCHVGKKYNITLSRASYSELNRSGGCRPSGKERFSALRASFWSKNKRGRGGAGSPGPSPGSDTELGLKVSVLGYCAHR